jgi:hypothetical protein
MQRDRVYFDFCVSIFYCRILDHVLGDVDLLNRHLDIAY